MRSPRGFGPGNNPFPNSVPKTATGGLAEYAQAWAKGAEGTRQIGSVTSGEGASGGGRWLVFPFPPSPGGTEQGVATV
jgi:hypothetical protein